MALLWSDRGEDQARASLRQVLAGLRKDLGEEAMAALCITDDAVSLDPDRVVVENANPGDELLSGFHLHDPAFEEWLRDERLRLEEESAPGGQSAPPAHPDYPSIAVLPFVNLSDDPAQEYFSDGITEDIITGLTRFRELFVIAWKTSLVANAEATDARQFGRLLGVAHIVEGSVRRSGNRVRVTAQLIEADSGHRVWADHYDRDLDDIIAVQDDISRIIVATLAGRIEESRYHRAIGKPVKDMASYDFLLRGRQCLNRGTKDDVLEARRHFRRAFELDPQSAAACANLAVSHLYEYESEWAERRAEALDTAYDLAQKAVALDRANSTAWNTLAWTQLIRKQHELSRISIERAIALNPNDYHNLCLKGWCLALSGDLAECHACLTEALSVNPFAPVECLLAMGIAEYRARHYEAAIQQFGKITGSAILKQSCLAACYAQLGRDGEARAAAAEALELVGSSVATQPEAEAERVRTYLAAFFHFESPTDFEHLVDGLRKAGVPMSSAGG